MPLEPSTWKNHFSMPEDRIWLNASHQGPLPNVAAEAVAEMVRWKQEPHHLITPEPFTEVPNRLRSVLAGVIGAAEEEVVLANSASYGLHLIANGLHLSTGDEVIVAANDFPSDILPWTQLRRDGVTVNQLMPNGEVLTAPELAAALTPHTKVVCLTWVHSFSGHVIDLDAIGEVCRSAGALFVVNASQGIGGLPMDVTQHPIDALTSVGFKYLCGPYGTGFCWLGERILDQIRPSKLYWLSALTADDLAAPELDLDAIEPPTTAARHDVFGTANFFNFAALAESANLVANIGIDQIYRHNLGLAERLTDGLDPTKWALHPRGPARQRSSIIFLKPLRTSIDEAAAALSEAGVDIVRRSGKIRFAPHFYNTAAEIDQALAALN